MMIKAMRDSANTRFVSSNENADFYKNTGHRPYEEFYRGQSKANLDSRYDLDALIAAAEKPEEGE